MNKNVRYFNFPIQLLKGFLNDSNKVLNNIFDYCLFEFTLRLDEEDGDNEDDDVVTRKMERAAKYFRLSIGNIMRCYKEGEKLYNSIPQKSPHCGLSLQIFWDFFENHKTDFEKVTLLKFLAIKSILGKKSYCKVTNNFVIARMDGNAKLSPKISPALVKFGKEYQFRKIKDELRLKWHMTSYGKGVRGFYVSFELNDEQLIYIAEMNRDKNKILKIRSEQKATVEKVRERIKNEFKISRSI